jgi:mitochondrial fission protein ELM1
MAPWGPIDPRDAPDRKSSPIGAPFPDIVIASGRRTIPYARAIKTTSKGETFVAILKDPRTRARFADLIWTPAHDRRRGDNVFTTLTSPHGLQSTIAAAGANTGAAIARLQRPLLGLVLGGPSGGARYDAASASALATRVRAAMKDFASLAVTPSRRTPPAFASQLEAELNGLNVYFWSGEGANPYPQILGSSDVLIVAADSHNMMSEAASAPAGVYAWRPPGLAAKLDWFVKELEDKGRVRAIDEDVVPFPASPIDATMEIAAEVCRRFHSAGK